MDTPQLPPPEFKPNIYPIMWWALAYGALASLAFLVIMLLSRYIGFPLLFLIGLVWGAYRNYQKQKEAWSINQGVPPQSGSFVQEFKNAFSDISTAGREMMAEQRAEDAAAAQAAAEAEAEAIAEEEAVIEQENQNQPFDSTPTSADASAGEQGKPPQQQPPQTPTV